MREIKFRQTIFINGIFSRFHYWGFIGEGIFHGPIDNDSASEQFTGLRDKNWREIYEGDILQYYHGGGWMPEIFGAVKYFDDWAQFMVGEGTVFTEYGEKPQPERWEIIGNIHENGELLK